jgi:hypothetical protein
MKKPFIIFIFLAALIFILAVLGRSPDLTVDQLKELVAQSREISRFASSPNPDFALLSENYEKGTRKIVRWVDAKLDIEMDDKIRESLRLGVDGTIPRINSLIVDLTIKRVFLEYIRYQIKTPDNFGKISIAVTALEPYFIKGEKWAGKSGELSEPIRQISKNVQPGASGDEFMAKIRTSLILCFLAELDEIERLKESNYSEALYHTAGAMQFLHMIYQDISVINRADAVFIYGEFSRKPTLMNIEGMRKKTKTGFAKTSLNLVNFMAGASKGGKLEDTKGFSAEAK